MCKGWKGGKHTTELLGRRIARWGGSPTESYFSALGSRAAPPCFSNLQHQVILPEMPLLAWTGWAFVGNYFYLSAGDSPSQSTSAYPLTESMGKRKERLLPMASIVPSVLIAYEHLWATNPLSLILCY